MRFRDVKDVTYSSNPVTGVLSVETTGEGDEISSSSDDEAGITYIGISNKSLTVTVEILEPDPSEFTVGDDATFVFTAPAAESGGSDVVATILNLVISSVSNRAEHGGLAGCTITGRSYSTDGSTNPLSVA